MPEWNFRGYRYRPVGERERPLLRTKEFRHEVTTPAGTRVAPPFDPRFVPDRFHFDNWVRCGCPPASPFGKRWLDGEFLDALWAVIRDCDLAGMAWGEMARVEVMLRDACHAPASGCDVHALVCGTARCWSFVLPARRRTLQRELRCKGGWRHEASIGAGEIVEAPFSPLGAAEPRAFRCWVELGCPPAAPFGRNHLPAAFLRRLARMPRELAGSPGDWNTLAVMEVLTRGVRHRRED